MEQIRIGSGKQLFCLLTWKVFLLVSALAIEEEDVNFGSRNVDKDEKLLVYSYDQDTNSSTLLEDESYPELYNFELNASSEKQQNNQFPESMNIKCKNDFGGSSCGAFSLVGCTRYKRFYAESTLKMNWYDSWEMCRSHGMIAASIDSRYEQNILETYLIEKDEATLKPYWTSGTDLGREGAYFWLATGRLFSSSFDYFLKDKRQIDEISGSKKAEDSIVKIKDAVQCVQLIISSDFTKSDYWDTKNCTELGFTLCQMVDA